MNNFISNQKFEINFRLNKCNYVVFTKSEIHIWNTEDVKLRQYHNKLLQKF